MTIRFSNEIPTDMFVGLNEIGTGSFSDIFSAIHVKTNTEVALKVSIITNYEEINLWSNKTGMILISSFFLNEKRRDYQFWYCKLKKQRSKKNLNFSCYSKQKSQKNHFYCYTISIFFFQIAEIEKLRSRSFEINIS